MRHGRSFAYFHIPTHRPLALSTSRDAIHHSSHLDLGADGRVCTRAQSGSDRQIPVGDQAAFLKSVAYYNLNAAVHDQFAS